MMRWREKCSTKISQPNPAGSTPGIVLFLQLLGGSLFATLADSLILPLYPEGAIRHYQDLGKKEIRERTNILCTNKVQTPTLEVYLPAPRSRDW
jgi:hypothetical protein